METVFAAADLGDTTVSAGLGTAEGGLFASVSARAPSGGGLTAAREVVASLISHLSQHGGHSPVALGLATADPVDSAHPAFLERMLGLPVRALDRSRCATLGELSFGHGREYSNFIYYVLGSQIRGGVVIDGRVRLGPAGAAGELGHQIVLPGGPLCACGNSGCLNALASGAAIARAAGYQDAGAAARAAREGDERAQEAFAVAGKYLGIAAANLVVALHPEAVLFAGSMSDYVDLLLVPVRAAVNDCVRTFSAEDVAVRRAGAGPQAILLGALALQTAPDKLAL